MTEDELLWSIEVNGKPPAVVLEAVMKVAEKLGATEKFIDILQEDFNHRYMYPFFIIAALLHVKREKFQALFYEEMERIYDGLDDAEIETAQKAVETWVMETRERREEKIEELKAK
jgi:hypothetical protein